MARYAYNACMASRYDGEDHTRWRSLYGHPDGRWLLMEGPCVDVVTQSGRVSDLRGDLIDLGPADGVVRQVYGWMLSQGPRKRPVQAELAGRLGKGQQAVSRYVDGTSYPDLSDEGWAELVRAYFEIPDGWKYGDPVPERATV